MKVVPIKLHLAPTLAGCYLELNGQDVSGFVSGLEIKVSPQEFTRCVLTINGAKGEVEGEALVNLVPDGVYDLLLDALTTDGAHHKQWYLEQIAETCGFDLESMRRELQAEDYDWEPGIAP